MTRQSAFPWRWAGWVWLPLAALLAVAATQGLWLAPLVRSDLQSRSGREVTIERVRLGLTPALAPVVRVDRVRIANAAWADAKQPFVDLERVVAYVSWRSLAERRPVLARLVLTGGSVDLERRADDLRNWRLRNPDDRGPGRYKILTLEAHDARVRFAHGGIDLDFTARAAPASTNDAALPTRIDAEGRWRGVPFEVGVDSAAVLTFLETDERFRLRGTATVPGLALDVDGLAGDLFRAPTLDAALAVRGRSIAALKPFIGPRYATPHPFAVKAHLKADARSYAFDGIAGTVGTTDLAGAFAWSHDAGRVRVRADLKSRSADVADLRWAFGQAPLTSTAKAVDEPQRRRWTAGRDLDIDVAYAAARLHAAEWPMLRSAGGRARVQNGVVAVDGLDVGVAGGHARGRVAIDTTQEPAAAEAQLELAGLRLLELAPALAGKLDGVLAGRASLRSRGTSPDEWKRHAAGTLRASLGDGRIASGLDARLGLELGKVARTFLSGDAPLPLSCAALAVDLAGGVATLRSLVVESANTRTTGTGRADLGAGTVDVVLTPQPKRPGLFDLSRSIRLRGPIGKPERALVDRAPAGQPGCPAAG